MGARTKSKREVVPPVAGAAPHERPGWLSAEVGAELEWFEQLRERHDAAAAARARDYSSSPTALRASSTLRNSSTRTTTRVPNVSTRANGVRISPSLLSPPARRWPIPTTLSP